MQACALVAEPDSELVFDSDSVLVGVPVCVALTLGVTVCVVECLSEAVGETLLGRSWSVTGRSRERWSH